MKHQLMPIEMYLGILKSHNWHYNRETDYEDRQRLYLLQSIAGQSKEHQKLYDEFKARADKEKENEQL